MEKGKWKKGEKAKVISRQSYCINTKIQRTSKPNCETKIDNRHGENVIRIPARDQRQTNKHPITIYYLKLSEFDTYLGMPSSRSLGYMYIPYHVQLR